MSGAEIKIRYVKVRLRICKVLDAHKILFHNFLFLKENRRRSPAIFLLSENISKGYLLIFSDGFYLVFYVYQTVI